jgi:site-specific DNA-cytosine methylase
MKPFKQRDFTSVAETCAGFGGVSQGYEKCGCEVEEVNEANPRFADWLRKQGKTVVEGTSRRLKP